MKNIMLLLCKSAFFLSNEAKIKSILGHKLYLSSTV